MIEKAGFIGYQTINEAADATFGNRPETSESLSAAIAFDNILLIIANQLAQEREIQFSEIPRWQQVYLTRKFLSELLADEPSLAEPIVVRARYKPLEFIEHEKDVLRIRQKEYPAIGLATALSVGYINRGFIPWFSVPKIQELSLPFQYTYSQLVQLFHSLTKFGLFESSGKKGRRITRDPAELLAQMNQDIDSIQIDALTHLDLAFKQKQLESHHLPILKALYRQYQENRPDINQPFDLQRIMEETHRVRNTIYPLLREISAFGIIDKGDDDFYHIRHIDYPTLAYTLQPITIHLIDYDRVIVCTISLIFDEITIDVRDRPLEMQQVAPPQETESLPVPDRSKQQRERTRREKIVLDDLKEDQLLELLANIFFSNLEPVTQTEDTTIHGLIKLYLPLVEGVEPVEIFNILREIGFDDELFIRVFKEYKRKTRDENYHGSTTLASVLSVLDSSEDRILHNLKARLLLILQDEHIDEETVKKTKLISLLSELPDLF